MYNVNFKKSWSELGNNIILFLPDLINMLFLFSFGYIILNITGLYDFFKDIPLIMGSEEINDTLFFLQSNLSTVIISVAVFVLGAFFFNALVVATKFGMIRDVINKKRASFLVGLSYINKYYWKIFEVKLRVFLMYVGALAVAILLNLILRAFSLDTAALVFSALLFVVLIVFIFLGLFFKYPILFTRNIEPKRVLGLSFKFFRENKIYTLAILGIIFLVAMVISIFFDILSIIPGIKVITQSLDQLATIIIGVWASVFTFNSYLKR